MVGVFTNHHRWCLYQPAESSIVSIFQKMLNGIELFTATCLNWQALLLPDDRKEIVLSSLKFMANEERVWLYGFVIMPNHIHVMWRRQDAWLNKSTEQIFLKFTAQQIKFKLKDHFPHELELYKSTQSDRQYHFWERRPYKATMYNREVARQKLEYMHNNPVKAGLCKLPEDYMFSSYRYYELNEIGSLLLTMKTTCSL